MAGTAFRTQQPCFSNDYLADERFLPWREDAIRVGVASSAVMPLVNGGQSLGVLIFNSTERDTFTPEMIELLWRLAENVSFALNNFDRIDEKSRIEDQKERRDADAHCAQRHERGNHAGEVADRAIRAGL